MTATQTNLGRDVSRIFAWAAVLPALTLWPFLSAFPAFSLIGGAGTNLAIAVNIVLFATGFWGVAGLAAMFWFCLSSAERARRAANRREKGLLVGLYATIWTGLFLIAVFASR